MKKPRPLVHKFTAAEIAAGQPQSVLKLATAEQLSSAGFLNEFHGRVLFTFTGHEPEPCVHSNAELRRFCRALHEQWPCWLWFGSLRTPRLADMLLACIPELQSLHRIEGDQVKVIYRQEDFNRVLQPQMQQFWELAHRAGWEHYRTLGRLSELCDYLFGQPQVQTPPN